MKYLQRAKRSAELDRNFNKANQMSDGKRIATDLLTGFGKTSYDVIRSTGISKGKAATLTVLGGPFTANIVRNNYVKQDEKHLNSYRSQKSFTQNKPIEENAKKDKKLSKRQAQKQYVNVNNAVAKRMNSGELERFNEKWKGKYNTSAYEKAYIEFSNKMFDEEYKKMYG